MIIRNGIVLHANRMENGSDVRLEDGTISTIGPDLHVDSGETVIEADGCEVMAKHPLEIREVT